MVGTVLKKRLHPLSHLVSITTISPSQRGENFRTERQNNLPTFSGLVSGRASLFPETSLLTKISYDIIVEILIS